MGSSTVRSVVRVQFKDDYGLSKGYESHSGKRRERNSNSITIIQRSDEQLIERIKNTKEIKNHESHFINNQNKNKI